MKKQTKKTKCGHKPYRGNLSGFLLGRWCAVCKKRIPLGYWSHKGLGFPLVMVVLMLSLDGCYAEKPAWRRHWRDVRIFSEVATNWIQIGTFTPSCGQSGCLVIHQSYKVERGQLETNWFAEIEWRWVKHRFLLEKEKGTDVGERRTVIGTATNGVMIVPGMSVTNIPTPGGLWWILPTNMFWP